MNGLAGLLIQIKITPPLPKGGLTNEVQQCT